MIETVIDFLMEFPSKAPVDTALLLITVVYVFLASRVFAAAGKRDHGTAARLQHWQSVFGEAARARRENTRPSAAE